MNKIFRFQTALVGTRWQDNVQISVCDDGLIESIDYDIKEIDVEPLVAIPGMVNVHSHAFQRGFAGLSEYRTADHDSFWTWRKLMYDYVNELTPDDVYNIARQLYREMLVAGYTWVGEFHYVHNEVSGAPYSNVARMSEAIFRAAADTGIGLCHLPVLYQRGGFANEPISQGQDRFVLDDDQFHQLVEQCHRSLSSIANSRLGIALHSLRAVSSKSGNRAVEFVSNLDSDAPIHIHVAEQTAEVDSCREFHEKRPVEFLYDEFPIDHRWCLIHATHLNGGELEMIANSNAVVGLCPTTEANLGDGIFRAEEFLNLGGRISIGSDSHCSVDMREEIRLLEYGQRLSTRRRAVLGTEEVSVGRNLYCMCASGGAQALGINAGEIAIGKRADFTLVDPSHAAIDSAQGDRILDRLVFANTGNPIAGVIVGGNRISGK